MHINPLIPYIPAFLSFFIYGYLSGFLFLLWKRSNWGCLLVIGFWYLYVVWCIFIFMLLGVQETAHQIWFVLGFVLAFLRPLLNSAGVQHLIKDFSYVGQLGHKAWQAITSLRAKITSSDSQYHANQHHQKSQDSYKQHYESNEEAKRSEQARRETEERVRSADKDKTTNGQEGRSESKNSESPTTDNRSPEDILGLKAGWTQEDLRRVYKSESQRTHPDKWIGKPQVIRHAMEEEYKNIQRAYQLLKT